MIPNEHERWRCGSLRQPDPVRRDAHPAKTQEYWHFDLAGEHQVERTEVLDETVESVTCRWCGRTDAIEVVPRNQ